MTRTKALTFAALLVLGLGVHAREAAAVTPLMACQTLTHGSYVLFADIQSPSGDCFVLLDDDITINFGNHTVSGGGTGAAITVPPAVFPSRVNILRGTITGFQTGIDLPGATQIQIQSMRIYGVSAFGIHATSNHTIIGDNIVHTTGVGIAVGCPSLLVQNLVEDNPGGNLQELSPGCEKVGNLGF